jgi:4-hydroxy-tetrahydrodipicolinate synthase
VIIYNVLEELRVICCLRLCYSLANDLKNIVAIKEAAGDMVQAMQILKDKPKDLGYFW